jgi:hypothetical protein
MPIMTVDLDERLYEKRQSDLFVPLPNPLWGAEHVAPGFERPDFKATQLTNVTAAG